MPVMPISMPPNSKLAAGDGRGPRTAPAEAQRCALTATVTHGAVAGGGEFAAFVGAIATIPISPPFQQRQAAGLCACSRCLDRTGSADMLDADGPHRKRRRFALPVDVAWLPYHGLWRLWRRPAELGEMMHVPHRRRAADRSGADSNCACISRWPRRCSSGALSLPPRMRGCRRGWCRSTCVPMN